MKPTFLIISGDGINCERETAQAFENAEASSKIIHMHELLLRPNLLRKFQGMVLPGGFSFGDELGSGQVLAVKLKYGLGEELYRFVESKKPVLGICNGFQTLLKLGLLPFPKEERCLGLTLNKGGHFTNQWVGLKVEKKSVCKWTKGLENFELPIRNSEGSPFIKKGKEKEVFKKLKDGGQIPLFYNTEGELNHENIAGVCDPEGLIFGLMPHPEAFTSYGTYHSITRKPQKKGKGQLIFDNIVNFIKGRDS